MSCLCLPNLSILIMKFSKILLKKIGYNSVDEMGLWVTINLE
jgi:hypothetical protein